MKSYIDEDGTRHERPIAYYFEHMNGLLDQDPELRAAVGLDEVTSCAEAEQFTVAEAAYMNAHPTDEIDMLPDADAQPASEEETFRIYYGWRSYVPGIVQINWNCSAVFITERHLLTAAHCFDSVGGGAQNIYIREQIDEDSNWGSGRDGYVHIHPNYTGNGDNTDVNDDIAIISLWNDLPWTPSPHRWYAGSTHLGTDLHIYGYGPKYDDGTEGNVQRQGQLNTSININYNGDGYFRAFAHTARICKGDSGGPAIHEVSGYYPVTWGLASQADFSNKCAEEGGDMRWTKTNVKNAWIRDKLLENLDGDFSCSSHTYPAGTYYKCF